jgi:hypothetical protein
MTITTAVYDDCAISTEIEDDTALRLRLYATERYLRERIVLAHLSGFAHLSGDALDVLARDYGLLRIHTHICRPASPNCRKIV